MRTHSKSNTAAPLNGLVIGAIIGVAMATFTSVLMFLIEFFLFADHVSFSGVKVATHPLPLVVFPFAGLDLSIIGIRLKNSNAHLFSAWALLQ